MSGLHLPVQPVDATQALNLSAGVSNKVHAEVDTNGLPMWLGLTPGQALKTIALFGASSPAAPSKILLADCGYDADWITVAFPAVT